jgi:hypothetical protein
VTTGGVVGAFLQHSVSKGFGCLGLECESIGQNEDAADAYALIIAMAASVNM